MTITPREPTPPSLAITSPPTASGQEGLQIRRSQCSDSYSNLGEAPFFGLISSMHILGSQSSRTSHSAGTYEAQVILDDGSVRVVTIKG